MAKITKVQSVSEKIIGLDFSMTTLFVSSLGEKANYPRYFREDEAKLHALSRSISRKKKGRQESSKSTHKIIGVA